MKGLGRDALVSVLGQFIHPSEEYRKRNPNATRDRRLQNCKVIRQEFKHVNRRNQLCVILHHNNYKNEDGSYIELHAAKRYCKVTQEGHTDYFFEVTIPLDVSENDQVVIEEPIPDHILRLLQERGNYEDAEELVEEINNLVNIDDDNEPAPENVPDPLDVNNNIMGK